MLVTIWLDAAGHHLEKGLATALLAIDPNRAAAIISSCGREARLAATRILLGPGALGRSTHLPGYAVRPPRPPSDVPPECFGDAEDFCNAQASRERGHARTSKPFSEKDLKQVSSGPP